VKQTASLTLTILLAVARIATPLLALLALVHAAGVPEPARPKLQFINGSTETMDIFWLKSDTERVLNGSVPPGKDTRIATTLGHRFEVVGRDDKTAAKVISEVPVQGFRFDPRGRDGVPWHYAQSVRAGGFPIVASARVNPYAIKEAAFIVTMMLAKRPEVRPTSAMELAGLLDAIRQDPGIPEWTAGALPHRDLFHPRLNPRFS